MKLCNLSVAICVLSVVASGPTAWAGLIRHDRDDSLYTDLANQSQFDAVGQLVYPDGLSASATLIGSGDNQWLVTAAHNFSLPQAYGLQQATGVRFTKSDGTVVEGQLDFSNLHFTDGTAIPGLFGRTEPDIALIKLTNPVDVTPAQLYDNASPESMIGKKVTYVGYGTTGDGINGGVDGPLVKRAGENVIDEHARMPWPVQEGVEPYPSPLMLLSDFDHPDDPSWDYNSSAVGQDLPWPTSDSTPLDLEYSIGGGDSGGATFVFVNGKWMLAGVMVETGDGNVMFPEDTSGLFSPIELRRSDEGIFGYGLITGSTPIGSNLDWITRTTGIAVVPEPMSVSLVLLASLSLGHGATRRRPQN